MPKCRRQILDSCRTLIVLWAGVLLWLAFAPAARGQSQYVFHLNIELGSGSWSQTGFRLKGHKGILTALHGVAGAKSIRARSSEGPILTESLTLREIDFERDLAVISSPEVDKLPDTGLELAPDLTDHLPKEVWVIGYPEGLSLSDITTVVRVHPLQPFRPLSKIIPTDLDADFAKRMSPSPDLSVLSLQNGIYPGHSGAPVCNEQFQVIAVANGGLKGGTVDLNWAIFLNGVKWKPAMDEQRLGNLAASDIKQLFRAVSNPDELEKTVEKLRSELAFVRRDVDDSVRHLQDELNVKDRIVGEQTKQISLLSRQLQDFESGDLKVSSRARELAEQIPETMQDPFVRALKAIAQSRFDVARMLIKEAQRQKEADLVTLYDLDGTNELYAGNYLASLQAFGQKESFLRTLQQGSKVREELADTLFLMGVISDLAGKKDDSIGSFEKAEAIQQILVAAEPGSARLSKNLAATYNSRGVLFLAAGMYADARKVLQQADEIFSTLRQEQPTDVVLMQFGANVLDNLADAESSSGRNDRARDFAERAQKLRERAVECAPEDNSAKLDLAVTLTNRAVHEAEAPNLPDAIALSEQALKIEETIIENNPKEYIAYADRARTLNNLSSYSFDAGNTGAALTQIETAAGDLIAAAPGLPESFRIASDLPRIYRQWGTLALQTGNAELARDRLNESARKCDQALETFKSSPIAQLNLEKEKAEILELVAALEQQSNHSGKAIAAFESVVAMDLKIVDQSQDQWQPRLALARAWYNLGNAQFVASLEGATPRKELLAASLENLQKADHGFVQGNSTDVHGESSKADLAGCRSVLGLVLSLLDKKNEAEKSFTEAISLAGEVLATEPNLPANQSRLGGALHNYALLLLENGNLKKGRSMLIDAVEHERKAVKAAPNVIQYRRYLGNHYHELGKVLRRIGESEEAVHWFEAFADLWPDDPTVKYHAAEQIALTVASWKSETKDKTKLEENKTRALSLLTDAFDCGLSPMVEVESDGAFQVLHGTPAFEALVAKLKERRKQ